MSEGHPPNYRYVGRHRRTKEDGRFVTGRGQFVQDLQLPGMLHAALVQSPYARARLGAIDSGQALASPGVVAVVSGEEIAAHISPLLQGIDAPGVRAWPLAHEMVRYAGEWVAVVVAGTRYQAEDAAELVEVDYQELPAAVDPEAALDDEAPLVHPAHGSNVMLHKNFTWGPVADDFAAAPRKLTYQVRWGRSSGVPIETFGVVARWQESQGILEIWASIQMPQYQEQIAAALGLAMNAVRIHNDVDVGGSFGTKRGIKQTVMAGYLARKLGSPIRLIEDRLEYMSGGDAHGPDRIFDITLAFDEGGVVSSMKMRALDDLGAYPSRAVQQMGKPITALCGPYRLSSMAYEAIAVATNKTAQVPVRGFGQAPTNYALESGIDRIARKLGLDRREVRRRNLIRHDEFPWKIPSGSAYDSGDYHTVLEKALELADWEGLLRRRDQKRAQGTLAGVGLATCLEPSGGNNIYEHMLNEKIEVTGFLESVLLKIDGQGGVTAALSTHSAGQGHQTLVATIVGEELERDPDSIRVVHSDSLEALPNRGPVASRMAIMAGSAAAKAAQRLKAGMMRIAAHDLGVGTDDVEYADGEFSVRHAPARKLGWDEIAFIAHRQLHRMPPDQEPGLQVLQVEAVPGGGRLPNEKGEVQIYPCYSFQAHVSVVEIDSITGQVKLCDHVVAHDCGTVINPQIVRGMIIGGVGHGVGAALYEKFDYDAAGQLLSGTLFEYNLPSARHVPQVREVAHCTPSPLTSHGQKGSGEGGYLGAPAAIAAAVNDALAPLGISIDELPMRPGVIEAALHANAGDGT
ncbi:MAG TPA: xanthine dehydrogenase family protein molybdopterin-binding subunit [Alphaproteobacteria bacterium]|jgi:2-furoyl-CoA dehydrogenase large subunit|nr:xanthine dehydrogenase family protein molybdopterin-binding subunit [Alphaproteobacteria bacterium]